MILSIIQRVLGCRPRIRVTLYSALLWLGAGIATILAVLRLLVFGSGGGDDVGLSGKRLSRKEAYSTSLLILEGFENQLFLESLGVLGGISLLYLVPF